jgi:hypothetical protein
MIQYFFISSPLHLMMAANVALQHPQAENVAILIAKSRGTGERFRAIAEQFPDLFARVFDLSADATGGRRARASLFRTLDAEFTRPMEARVFTGNDRRIEFQYAMHAATRAGATVEGIYLDEGAVTYAGHKSMNNLAHRFIDPLFKKLVYGFWYKQALTTGTSAWIQTALVAFPDAVHPLLKHKRLEAIDPAPFKTPPFRALAAAMLGDADKIRRQLCGIKLVLTLPHEGAYLRNPDPFREIGRILLGRFASSKIAVKAHPRIARPDLVPDLFPGVVLLDSAAGMEAMLPLLDDGCIVAGDVSSTLLTTRWLRPDLPVLALDTGTPAPDSLLRLFARLGIPRVDPAALADRLANMVKG